MRAEAERRARPRSTLALDALVKPIWESSSDSSLGASLGARARAAAQPPSTKKLAKRSMAAQLQEYRCAACGGVLPLSRREHHERYWCTARAPSPDDELSDDSDGDDDTSLNALDALRQALPGEARADRDARADVSQRDAL